MPKVMMNEDAVYERVIYEYLQMLDTDTIPTPAEIRDDLLNMLASEIDAVNESLPKTAKFVRPRVLPPVIIALVMLKLYDIRRIVWGDELDEGELFIYQTTGDRKGIYVNDERFLKTIISEYSFRTSVQNTREVLECLSIRAKTVRVNNDPDLIPVNNGIFNYKTKELMPFSPEYIFTSKSAVDYNPCAKNVVIHNNEDNTDWDVDTWVGELSDDKEIVDLLWQIIGASVRPYVLWEKVVCMYSEKGNNGKGTLCQLIRNLCGENSTRSMAFDEFDDDFALESLMRASAIITDENTTGVYIKETAALKAIITNDKFQVKRKFKTSVTMRFNGLMIQCINGLPKFGDKSESLYRRLMIVPFDKCFTGIQRKYIKHDYICRKDVLEYVLYKVLNTNYYTFDVPERCVYELNEYKTFNDPIRDFLGEMLPELQWKLVPYAFLYDLYKAWFAKYGANGQFKGKRVFINDVRNILDESTEWQAPKNAVPTRDLMNEFEPLIITYDLNDWKSSYKGSDVKKICAFTRKSCYKGIVKI